MSFQTPNSEILLRHLPAVGTRIDIRAAAADAATLPDSVECLVVAIMDGEDGLELVVPHVVGEYAKPLLEALEAVDANASLETTTRIPAPSGLGVQSVIAVGLGNTDPDAEIIRRASGAAGRAAKGATSIATALGDIDAQAAAEGFALGAYSYSGLKSLKEASESESNETDSSKDCTLHVIGATDAEIQRSTAIVDAVCTARDLVNAPSSHLYPEVFANIATDLGEAAGLTVTTLDDVALEKQGFGGLTAVGGGSARGPRLVRMEWAGKGESDAKMALVGKGVTFDTGGISLKPGASMENMISDMGGAAAVIATVVLAAKLETAVPVVATIPMAENMPDGKSYRPGDVVTQYGGKTIEILNTDAEGRLILADALVRACEDQPTHLIDTATLTGAQLVALGGRTPGVLGTDEFRDRVAELSREIGENGWAMPMPEELTEGLKSPVADLRNVTTSREGGMSVAAAYLREFVADDVQWAHIDVAGPAFNTNGAWGYTPKRGTGVPVRTMLAVIENLE
ncbi:MULTISPECIES: leucyl aminopeptidase [unclassified Corynebacterium]|uniref:leucyl aminopeptidase n=1 Tax=unclassified Corynebacterium TaxID=2624378 RepID=UPI00309E98D3